MESTYSAFNCSMCGHSFDPNAHAGCSGCPLQKGCSLVCCPACGYEMINPQQSRLARLAQRLLRPQPAGTRPDRF